MEDKLFTNLILLIPEKDDIERDAVAEVWESYGGEVIKVGRFWEPPAVDSPRVRVYGNSIFCLVLAQKYGLTLISPDDDLLRKISEPWLKRKIIIKSLSEIEQISFPCFIKPLVPKLFTASIYKSKEELLHECRQLDDSTPIIISDIVKITAEVRAFILDGEIKTASFYEGEGDLNSCRDFLNQFLSEYKGILPKTLVIDVGLIDEKGWGIIEANASWGAGLNGCDPKGAAVCVSQAAYCPPSMAE